MATEWGILQLRDLPDPMPVQVVEQDLKRRWPGAVCRFPAVKQGVLDRDNPMSAYVFVRVPLSPRLETSPYAVKLLRDPVTRRLQKVTDAELRAMSPSALLPRPGSTIRVTAGDWAGLDGTIVEVNGQSVKVLVELWSRQRVLTLAPNEFQSA